MYTWSGHRPVGRGPARHPKKNGCVSVCDDKTETTPCGLLTLRGVRAVYVVKVEAALLHGGQWCRSDGDRLVVLGAHDLPLVPTSELVNPNASTMSTASQDGSVAARGQPRTRSSATRPKTGSVGTTARIRQCTRMLPRSSWSSLCSARRVARSCMYRRCQSVTATRARARASAGGQRCRREEPRRRCAQAAAGAVAPSDTF